MRRCYRRAPTRDIVTELARRRRKVGEGLPLAIEWKNFRATNAGQAWADILADCTGARRRCMYCSDSNAADIEHYRPKEGASGLAFTYTNHLFVCPSCNRSKGTRFPLAANGSPLLINPFEDDPWSVFFIDTDTGVLVPRYLPSGDRDMRGVASLELLAPLAGSAAEIGRARAARRLREAARKTKEAGRRSAQLLLEAVDDDDYDMSSWFLLWEGSTMEEFSDFPTTAPDIYRRFARRVIKKRQGIC